MTILANPLYASRRFDTIAALTASGLTYAPGSVNTVVAGNRVEAEGLQYEVAPSGAVDQHLTTAGGARLYEAGQRYSNRARLVQAVARGMVPISGQVYTAGGLEYRGQTGATDILDLPGLVPNGEKLFGHYGGIAARADQTRAEIKHRRTGGIVYDVVTIINPKLDTLTGRVIDGMVVGTGQSTRITPREFAIQKRIPALFNFAAFRNADGSPGFDNPTIVPNGFLIVDGVAYTDWISGTNANRAQGFTVQKNGTMVQRTRGVGTASDYVADGALFGTSWGCWLVWNGVDVHLDAVAFFDTTTVSARNIIGQRPNGDWVLIAIEGVTGTYGATTPQAAAACLAEGCVRAFLMEGGGSVQLWWDNFYACPSSDGQFSSERTLQSFLAIDCPLDTYDTGFVTYPLESGFTEYMSIGLRTRQVGAIVHLETGITGTFTDSPVVVTPDITQFIRRFRPRNGNAVVRGFVSGVSGAPGMFFLGAGLSMRTLNGGSPSYLAGSASWTTLYAP